VSTVYAHLNGFAARLKRNQAVSQGEIIGYVGSTGWATGPHLHYEVRINDLPQDPMRMALPMAAPLAGRELDAFRRATGPLLERFALLNNRESVVASSR
jgi:murein DD-endopeptidase MepM/ murein hydrolase activator NlpD